MPTYAGPMRGLVGGSFGSPCREHTGEVKRAIQIAAAVLPWLRRAARVVRGDRRPRVDACVGPRGVVPPGR